MKCPNCKLVEMMIERVVDNIVHYKCKKCGKEMEQAIEEDKNRY